MCASQCWTSCSLARDRKLSSQQHVISIDLDSLSSLSRETAKEALSSRNIPDSVHKNLENVIWECETALYASGGSKQMAHTYEEAIKVISDLEDVFKA